jgi:hypothetical protein
MAKSTTHIDGILATLIVLGADKKSIDAETLTVGCFKAFPSLFSMDLFKDYPRIDRVKNRIKDLLHEDMIIEHKDGFYKLTEKGKEWRLKKSELVRRAEQLLSNTELKSIESQNIADAEFEKEKKKLKRTSAYSEFGENKSKITIMDFMDFLKIDIYSTRQLFERKVKRIKAICMRDNELKELFIFMSKKFGERHTDFKIEIDRLLEVKK